MRILRRTLATAAASFLAVTALAPAASAQPNLGDLLANGDALIAQVECKELRVFLDGAKLRNDTTTRNGLVRNINAHTGDFTGGNVALNLLVSKYSNQIADKALDCKLVKPDAPELFPGSSKVSDLLLTLSSK